MAAFLRYVAAGFMIGVFTRSFFVIPPIFAGIIAVLGLIFVALSFVEHSVFNKVRVWISAAAILIGMGLGMFRYEAAVNLPLSPLADSIGKMVTVCGMIAAEPEMKDRYQRVVVAVNDEKVLVYAPRYPELKYGDLIEARGKLTEPENFNDPATAGQVFDWRAYLAKDGIHYEIKNAAVAVTGGGGSGIKRLLFAVARDFKERIDLLIPEPEAAFLGGLLLGDKSGLPSSVMEDFRRAGVMHLVALSGYNISVVAAGVTRILSYLPIGIAAVNGAGLLAVALFVIMTGASSTAIRAGLMAVLIVLARGTGRLYAANNALLVVAFFMTLWNPLILKDDISFQLSFLATWGIINIAPYLLKKINFVPTAVLRDALATTLAAQIMVTPLLLHSMGYLSVASLPANLAILPFVPWTMAAGFAVYPFSFLWILAQPTAWVTDIFLRYELGVAHFWGNLPFSGIAVADFSGGFVILSYVAIFYWYSRIDKRDYEKPNNSVAQN